MSAVSLLDEKHALQWSSARTVRGRNDKGGNSFEVDRIRQYATRIHSLSLSNHQLFNGRYLRPLANFLSRYDASREETGDGPTLAAICYYEICNRHIAKRYTCESTNEFLNAQKIRATQHGIYFLTGSPSPDWLNCLGSGLNVPPAFWTSHLDFFVGRGQEEYCRRSALLAAPQVISLCIPSVVFVGAPGRHLSQEQLQVARRQGKQEIHSRLQRCRRSPLPTSLYRTLNVHRGDLLSVEQKVTMLLLPPKQSQSYDTQQQWSVIVYTDSSTASGGLEDILSRVEHFRDKMKLRFCPLALSLAGSGTLSQDSLDLQSAEHESDVLSQLASEYDSVLRSPIETHRPFDALAGIFEVALLSTVSLTSSLEEIIDEQLERFSQPAEEVFEYATSLTFQVHRGLLNRQVGQLKQIRHLIHSQGGPQWLLGGQFAFPERSPTWEHLLASTEQLLEQVESLLGKCDQGEVLVDKRRSSEEFHKSNYQAQLILRLTHITTFATIVLLPLSILTSVFGMNFQEFDAETLLNIWVWGASAAGCTALSLAFWWYFMKHQG